MNKRPSRSQLTLALHCLVVLLGVWFITLASGHLLTYYKSVTLNPSQIQRTVSVSVLPASGAIVLGSHGALSVRIDKEGQVPTKISLAIGYSSDILTIGGASSPDPDCQQTLSIVSANNQIALSCSIGQTDKTEQLEDIFSLPYTASQIGSANVGLLPSQSSASGPVGTLSLSGLDASLTVIH